MNDKGTTILLFDVDGTLTSPRQVCHGFADSMVFFFQIEIWFCSDLFIVLFSLLFPFIDMVSFPLLPFAIQKMDQAMRGFMMEVHKTAPLAIVSGSDLPKIIEQLGESLEDGKVFNV